VYFGELDEVLDRVEGALGSRPRVLFLEASDDALVRRFKETRRPHPLAADGSLSDGIERERASLAPLRERADLVIDTSDMTIWGLRRAIGESLGPGSRPRMAVIFASFGYKHGMPQDVDLIFDVRFLRNPHYVAALSPYTGSDAEVRAYVEESPGMEEFLPRLTSLLDFLLPVYAEEGRAAVVVGFGCTGGRHRSVALAEMMAERFGGDERFRVATSHRHVRRSHTPTEAP
jgi:UPF0042 nucleotide-binding protein